MLYYVCCLNDNVKYGYVANTPYEALKKHQYFLGLSKKVVSVVNKTDSGMCLYFEHNGKIYSILN